MMSKTHDPATPPMLCHPLAGRRETRATFASVV